ncbi:MAG TPA: triose-phosphate isomerase [Methylomirabilota bacterium]|jgi:triosephosphate isomerase|nr:triose-phosphate isomerase [Methylomirabilota bacterium]
MAVREPTVVANWKMHTSLAEARALAQAVRDGSEGLDGVRIVLCPPFTALAAVGPVLAGSDLGLGAQDAHWEAAGAFTGAISPAQVADAGARVVILGHSERRQVFGETDAVVQRKVRAALAHGLTPLLCVGETATERAAGTTAAVVTRQLGSALAERSADEIARCWVAYEPVWAIGTGQTATPAQAAEVHATLRDLLRREATRAVAERCPILYGGSIKPDNMAALMAEAEVDGGLVGGASLKAADFLAIVRAAREATGRRPPITGGV